MDNFGLPQQTIDTLLNYFKKNSEIEKVVIYGSRAKGTYHNGSDIDFAIWTNGNVSKILGELDELPTPYMFDVTDYKKLQQQEMKQSIDKFGKLFYSVE